MAIHWIRHNNLRLIINEVKMLFNKEDVIVTMVLIGLVMLFDNS